MKHVFISILVFIIILYYGKAQADLTAEDIVNRSIKFCGGVENISRIKTTDLIYDLTTSDSNHASLIIKRVNSQKYMRSLLSDNALPTSMHYDGTTLTAINGENKTTITDVSTIEEIKLLTYYHPQVGYRELSYSLKRLEDQQFNNFNCYVVSATAKNGYTILAPKGIAKFKQCENSELASSATLLGTAEYF
jgi:hypothetical protein